MREAGTLYAVSAACPDGGGSGRQAADPSGCGGGCTEPDDLLVLCGEPGEGPSTKVREFVDGLLRTGPSADPPPDARRTGSTRPSTVPASRTDPRLCSARNSRAAAAARRATVLARPVGDVAARLLAVDRVFRPSAVGRRPTVVRVSWAPAGDGTRRVPEDCRAVARDRTRAMVRLETAVAGVRSGQRWTAPRRPPRTVWSSPCSAAAAR